MKKLILIFTLLMPSIGCGRVPEHFPPKNSGRTLIITWSDTPIGEFKEVLNVNVLKNAMYLTLDKDGEQVRIRITNNEHIDFTWR